MTQATSFYCYCYTTTTTSRGFDCTHTPDNKLAGTAFDCTASISASFFASISLIISSIAAPKFVGFPFDVPFEPPGNVVKGIVVKGTVLFAPPVKLATVHNCPSIVELMNRSRRAAAACSCFAASAKAISDEWSASSGTEVPDADDP